MSQVRWRFPAAVCTVLLALTFSGCGGGGDDAPAPCTDTCASIGAACGTVCGVTCGTCDAGETCNGGACALGGGGTTPDPGTCTPQCDTRACGDDGCGGSCGTCDAGTLCNPDGACVSSENCTDTCASEGQLCGSVCGVECGTCDAGTTCVAGSCECAPSCAGKTCGDDGCGGNCGSCSAGDVCDANGICVGAADCTDTCASVGASCGTVCGESCGVCAVNENCQAGQCECTPNCAGSSCGDDGCGGSCGGCADGLACSNGQCIDCCAGKDCGSVTCGDSQVLCGDNGGECLPGEVCGLDNLCRIPGLPNGSYCGITADCQPNIPNPQDPSEEIQNPAYPSCMSEQCDSNFCLQDFAPGEVVFINACSVHCTITKDEVNNDTGLPGADGVEDEDAPYTDCTGFEGGGPAGDSYKCVSSGLPGQAATALCAPGTTFRECDGDSDCPEGESCQITQLGGQMQERCMTVTQPGEWGAVAPPTGMCNDDPFDGDVQLCAAGLCFIFGCVHFCGADTDCDTTQIEGSTGSCIGGTCSNWAGKACEADIDCSAWSCKDNYNPFGDNLPSYSAGMCWPNGCGDIDDCPDNYYCRWWWNGATDEADAGWDHLCHRETDGGAALGEECDGNPDDNIPGATCAGKDLCLGGRCSALCSTDDQCATGAPANQKCITEEVPFDTDDDGFYNYILPLEYCRSFEGYNGDCYSDMTCGADETCTPYEVANWIEDPANPGEMILNPDAGYVLKGACVANDDSGGDIGKWGDPCGVAGTANCESFCLGADEATGQAGICTQLCESSADCPTFGEGETETQGRCSSGSNFRAGWGGTFDVLTDDLYYSLCIPAAPSSEQDCSDGSGCPDGEGCIAYEINFGPDYAATTEYICEGILTEAGEGGTLATGDSCDPEATDGAGDPMTDCAGVYCAADTLSADPEAQEYYCSQTCNPDGDACPAGLVCHGGISMPKAGAYESNQSMVYTCRKDQECSPCGINTDCVGDRVCVNMGSDDADNAFYACVDACETAADCLGTACTEGMDVLEGTSMGCFDAGENKCN